MPRHQEDRLRVLEGLAPERAANGRGVRGIRGLCHGMPSSGQGADEQTQAG